MVPDLLFTNARILTMDPENPRAQAVAIGGGEILAVGDSYEIEALAGPKTRVIDAGGCSLLPGFVESHLHLVFGGAELQHLQVGGLSGLDALRAAFKAYGAAHPDLPLLMAQGANYVMLDHPVTRHDMDAILADRPIAMSAHDHHTVWANTAALQAAGLLHGRDLPPGHEVVMGADGLATGELREFEAFVPIYDVLGEARLHFGIATGAEPEPWPSPAEQAVDRAKVLAGLRHCAAQGITSMVNMDGNRYTLELLRGLQAEGNLLARVRVPFHFKPHMGLEALERAEAMHRNFQDDWLSSGFVKLFMDGVVESGTAFMAQDYPDQPGHRGDALFTAERFAEIATEIDRRGLQIAVHAIGDGAVKTVIDGYVAAEQANGRRDSRHRLEHIELIDRADVPRLAAHGIVASLQPAHAPGALDFPLEPALTRIGAARWGDAYLCRDLVEAGAPLAFASDWPVADVSVLRGVKAALTRPVYPGARDQRLGLMATLQAYTAGGAWAAHREAVTGRIRAGMAADLVLLSEDLEAVAPEALDQVSVRLTLCGGRVTYEPV